jgi:tetratricopeptide (TPR) repeat protein
LRKRGFEHAIDVFNEAKKKDASFLASETDLNDWAYRMMSRGQKKEALEIFKLNVSLYPESANTYDSVAEAYETSGNQELAIKNYK